MLMFFFGCVSRQQLSTLPGRQGDYRYENHPSLTPGGENLYGTTYMTPRAITLDDTQDTTQRKFNVHYYVLTTSHRRNKDLTSPVETKTFSSLNEYQWVRQTQNQKTKLERMW
jgi:hypothetical protein